MVEHLLTVEDRTNPTEIVIHVNMLKEGWDVTNLYTIVPLRAANARTLIEQSIGRGLRLPYGKRDRRHRRGPAEHRRARPVPGDRGRGQQAGLSHPPAAGRLDACGGAASGGSSPLSLVRLSWTLLVLPTSNRNWLESRRCRRSTAVLAAGRT